MDRLMPGRTTVHLVFVFVLQFVTTLQQQQSSSQQAPLQIEWFALIHLRTSLGIRANEWPIKLNPCTNWKGVECRNGSVVGINISGFRRTRFVRPNPKFDVSALQNLTRLEIFNASFFTLPGRIPDLFGQSLGKLQVLDLHSCSISGTIPFNFGNLSSLSTLILSLNNLTGTIPPTFGQLRNLSVLNLSQNLLTGSIPLTFASLQNLSVLDFSSNFLSGSIPPGIGSISNLIRLNLSGNSLSSFIPPQLGDLASLVHLDLSLNSLSGPLSLDLRGLKSLQKMVIGHNRLSGALANDLFISLTRLEFVNLNWNNFSGAIPDALLLKPSLRFLDVSRNKLTGRLPDTILRYNFTTAVLNLSHNLYYGELTSVLQRFSSIDLSGNYFEGKVPDYAQLNSSLSSNCLQNVTKQRTLQDCSSFYYSRSLVFDNFGGTDTTAPAPAPHPAKNSHRQMIILVAAVAAGIVIMLLLLLLLFLRNRRVGASNPRGNGVGPIPTAAAPSSPGASINFVRLGGAFTYQQLLQVTGEFNDANFIKRGHSGDFYRGVLEGGIPIVIKKIDLVSVKNEAYLLELDFFSKVSHPRLVPLLGHCLEKENEKYLVYKYMPNEDLTSSLYRKANTSDDGLQSLDWITRLKIAIGTAEGLSYLHHECAPPFVHRDVQASSILLDDKYEVRLSSLSEVCIQEGDGHQSVISWFLRLQQTSEQGPSGPHTATCAFDVYCFGKVLLELVTGKLGISASNDASVKAWLDQILPCINIYDKELITKIIDPSLILDEDLLEEVWAMAIVARSCLNPKPSRRPLMRYILRALENPLKVVREENTGSARLRTTSSIGSWNAALFGSWRHSSDVAAAGPSYSTATRAEGGTGSFRRSGTSGSQGSDHNGGGGGDRSSSHRRQSREIYLDPSSDVRDVQRRGED